VDVEPPADAGRRGRGRRRGPATLTTNVERGVLAGVFYAAGALVAAIAAAGPRASSAVLFGLAGCAGTVALIAVLARRSFVYGATLVTSSLGPPLIAVGVIAGGGGWGSALAASLFTFVAVHAALVLRWQHSLALYVWGAATAGIAVWSTPGQLPLAPALAVFALVCGTLAAVTTWLVQALQRQAATDPLTGIANRSAFGASLAQACATVERTGEPLSVLVLDLDGFKRFNDTLGHAAGDRALVATAERWEVSLRARDTIARLGGDEFAVILPGADSQEAREIAERLRASVPDGLGCSIGIATARSWQGLEELQVAADRAMYADKARRRRPPSAMDATPR
jgi:diguanylate cyclase (GGDEF)-like protein